MNDLRETLLMEKLMRFVNGKETSLDFLILLQDAADGLEAGPNATEVPRKVAERISIKLQRYTNTFEEKHHHDPLVRAAYKKLKDLSTQKGYWSKS